MFIKDKKISSISGPVSFSLLKPKKFIFEELKKEGVHLPIFMFFGDIHFSNEKQCDKCSCNLQDRSCCMPVYSNDFLRLIDSMATKEYPIDFGIEGFTLFRSKELFKEHGELGASYYKNVESKDIMEKIRENIEVCYQRDLKGTELYEKYCPTKNIRWHYMDARQAWDSKYNLETLIASGNLAKLDKKIFSTDYKDKKELKKDIDEVKANFDSDEMWKLIIGLKIMLIKNPEEGMESYFKIGESFKNSLVLKQFNKLSKSFKDLPFWKKSLSDYLVYVLKEDKDELYNRFNKVLDNPQKEIDEARIKYYYLLLTYDIDGLFELLSDSFDNTYPLARAGSFFNLMENSIFFDLYYIFRTFKIPKGDKNPFLSILYAGDIHTRNLKYFLTNIIKYYEIVEEVNMKGDLYNQDSELRCTYMPSINFNDLALEYGVDVNKPAPKPYVSPVVQPKPYVSPYVAPSRGSRRSPARGAKAGRKTSARRAPARRSPARRSTAPRKTSVRRAPARRSSAPRKTSARRSPAPRKTSARRSPARRRK